MKKLSVCVLFGGVSPEHEVSLRSAEFVLNCLDHEPNDYWPYGWSFLPAHIRNWDYNITEEIVTGDVFN